MSGRILGELDFFVHSLIWGMQMALLYDGLRLLRRLLRHGRTAVAAEDLFYWLAYGFLLFRMIYLENDGIIRGFALLAVLLGMILYFKSIKWIIFFIKKLQNALKSIIIKNSH